MRTQTFEPNCKPGINMTYISNINIDRIGINLKNNENTYVLFVTSTADTGRLTNPLTLTTIRQVFKNQEWHFDRENSAATFRDYTDDNVNRLLKKKAERCYSLIQGEMETGSSLDKLDKFLEKFLDCFAPDPKGWPQDEQARNDIREIRNKDRQHPLTTSVEEKPLITHSSTPLEAIPLHEDL
jgi:hypothetical protein